MDERTYNIILSDGTTFDNLRMNGNNYVSDVEVTEDMFYDLSNVTITDSEGNAQEYKRMELIQIAHYSDGYYISLREMSPAQIKEIETDAQITYTALMTDTLIEEV